MLRILAWVLAALLAGLAAFAGWRTLEFGAPPPAPPAAEALDLDAAAIAGRLAGALRFPTVSHADPAADDAATFARFLAYLRASYPHAFGSLQVETVNGRSLLLRWPGKDPAAKPVMLIAHYDVVPVDAADLPKWHHAPFAGDIAEGFVWGRGALDDKGSVIAIMEALELLLDTGWQPARDVYVGFGHDEEVGGEGGAGQIAALLSARKVRLEFILDEGGAVMLPGVMPGLEVPLATVGVAEKGYLNLRLTANASGGHSSMPRADAAIPRLANALVALQEDPFPRDLTHLRQMAEAAAPWLRGGARVAAANMWLTGPLLGPFLDRVPALDASTRVTVAPTVLHAGVKDNVQPTSASALLNLRLMPGSSADAVRARVAEIVAPWAIGVEAMQANEASPGRSATDNAAWGLIADAIRHAAGGKLGIVPFLTMGGTDLKHYYPLTDNHYRFGYAELAEADLARVHGIDERVSTASLLKSVRFYHRLLRQATAAPHD